LISGAEKDFAGDSRVLGQFVKFRNVRESTLTYTARENGQARRQSRAKSLCASVAFAVLLTVLTGCTSPEQKAKNYHESGQQYLESGDYVRAALEFRNALKITQDYADAWYGMAQVEQNAQNWNAVAGNLNKVLELDPNHKEARPALARLMLLGGSPQEAMKIIDIGLAQNSIDAPMLALKAAVQIKLGEKQDAVKTANKALELNPKNIDALMILASERVLANDFAGAKVQLEKGLAFEPKALALHLFGLSLAEKTGNVNDQEASIRNIIAVDPKQITYRRALVTFFINQKRFADAEKEIRSVASENPEDVTANLDLVRYLVSFPGKGPDAALNELNLLIASGKNAFEYKKASAQLLFETQKYDEAFSVLKDIIVKEGISEPGIAARLDLANKYISLKRYDVAEPLVAEALTNDAKNVEGLRLRAALKVVNGDLEGATNDVRAALNEDPRNPALYRTMAAINEQSGSIELADKSMLDAFKASNSDVGTGLDYVRFLVRRGQNDRAESILSDLLQRAPSNIDVLAMLADMKLRRQDWVGAQQLADAIKKAPGSEALSSQIAAAALVGQNRLDESVQILLDANRQNPSSAVSRFALVRAYLKGGKFKEAEDYLMTVLVAEPGNSEARTFLGVVQANTNRKDLAKLSFEAAIASDPTQSPAYRTLADFQMREGQSEAAILTLKNGLEKNPKDLEIKFLLASIYERLGNIDAAISTYEEMLVQEPNSMIAANNYASLISDYRSSPADIDKAAKAGAVLRGSPIAQFKDTLGWILYLRGQHGEALDLLKQSTADLPDMALTNYHLAMAYQATGDTGSAKASFERALKLARTDKEKSLITSAMSSPPPVKKN
jgi:cellulose synthase operon protein C